MTPDLAPQTAAISSLADILLNSRYPRISLRKNKIAKSGRCFACGRQTEFIFLHIINDQLAAQWGLTKNLRKSFDIRESSKCTSCGSSLRSRLQARAICKLLAPEASSLAEAVKTKKFRQLKIAEINANGALHKILVGSPSIKYSEYRPADKATRHEDLNNLSYQTNYFDAVLTSETLEHVPDWRRAKSEIYRVLKPGGRHIFTLPAIMTRKSRARAVLDGRKIVKLLPASYHGFNRGNTEDYLVFNEFGADFRRAIDEIGFDTKIYYRSMFYLSDPNLVFVSTKKA